MINTIISDPVSFVDEVNDLLDNDNSVTIKEVDEEFDDTAKVTVHGDNGVYNVQGDSLYVRVRRNHEISLRVDGKQRFLYAEQVNNVFTVYYGKNVIHSAGYTPALVFHGEEDFFFGQELEFVFPSEEKTRAAARALYEISGKENLFWIKTDCSLPEGRNLEVVTHPCNFKIATDLALQICGVAKKFEAQTINCGHHCHVNRDIMSTETIAQLLLIVNRRWSDIEKSCGRTVASLNGWAGNPLAGVTDENKKAVAMEIADGSRYVGRNCAVNVTNKNTVEFRFAAGTTDGKKAVKNLQFYRELLFKARHGTV